MVRRTEVQRGGLSEVQPQRHQPKGDPEDDDERGTVATRATPIPLAHVHGAPPALPADDAAAVFVDGVTRMGTTNW